ncbi:ABC transporter substrate-binding protein, partial [Candidatus Bipolaricaulota bacterium]|nr:ABC transporter substrate-binding protein [Candidatus Bipolaricaulota bacterium]
MKQIVTLCLILLVAFAAMGAAQEIRNPDTLIYMSYGTLNSMDPAYVYDTDSGGLIFQVYENLFSWPYGTVDGNEKDLSWSLADTDLVPMLGTVVPTVANGLVVVLPDGQIQYTIPIRQGIVFHEGGTLTAEDVEYSFERGVLQDRRGGPQWMFFEAFSGYEFYGLSSLAGSILGREISRADVLELTADEQAQVYAVVDEWIEVSVDGKSVTFTIGADYPPFLGMLGHGASWGAILDKEWVIEQGGWDGQPGTWAAVYNPGAGTAAEESELYDKANGTGPYKLTLWDPGVERVYERFDGYWRAPAPIKTVIHRQVQAWTARFLAFENHDADIVTVDPQYVPQVEVLPGVTIHTGLPSISMNPVMFFTTDMSLESNDFVGSGTFAEDGIASDFFNDINVRRAFNYSFDAQLFIDESYGAVGGYTTHGPIPQAFAWAYNPDPAILYSVDLEKAEAEFRLANSGTLWDTGFTFTIVYNEGNDSRRAMAEMLEFNIESLNPKFHIDLLGMPWTNQLDFLLTERMPLFIIGWVMDYPDPHNFAQPFLQSDGGGYASWQGAHMIEIYETYFDDLVAAGMA